jgi:hypothetical protein
MTGDIASDSVEGDVEQRLPVGELSHASGELGFESDSYKDRKNEAEDKGKKIGERKGKELAIETKG